MYLRVTQRRRRDGTKVRYLALAENVWNAESGQSEARIIYNFGRTDGGGLDKLQRLDQSIHRVIKDKRPVASGDPHPPRIETDRIWALGLPHVAQTLWHDLGIADILRRHLRARGLEGRHERVALALVLNELEAPRDVPADRTPLSDQAWLGDAPVDDGHRIAAVLSAFAERGFAIEQEVFQTLSAAFGLNADTVFYTRPDTLLAACARCRVRRRWSAHSADDRPSGRAAAEVIATSADGMPAGAWTLPATSGTADARCQIEHTLVGRLAARAVCVMDAPDDPASWLDALDQRGRLYLVGLPMSVLPATGYPGRYRSVGGGLRAKEVHAGDTRTRRYIIVQDCGCKDRPTQRETGPCVDRESGLAPPSPPPTAEPAYHPDATTYAIVTNDSRLSTEEIARAYHFTRVLGVRLTWMTPLTHPSVGDDDIPGIISSEAYRPHTPHVLALQLQRAAELRSGRSWGNIAHLLSRLHAVRYRTPGGCFVQPTAVDRDLAHLLGQLGVPEPPATLHDETRR